MDKKQLIDQIEKESELSKVIEDLLRKLKLEDVDRVSNNLVVAFEDSTLKKRKSFFIICLSELNGKVPAISERISSISEPYDQIFIVTSHHRLSEYFKNWISEEHKGIPLEFWSRDTIIELIDEHYEEFWRHNDSFLIPYELKFSEDTDKDKQLKSLLKLDDKFDKLFDIFITPKLYLEHEDPESGTLSKSRVHVEKIVNDGCYIISGEAGTGKSTLLKEIGKKCIERNNKTDVKTIPVFIKASQLLKQSFSVYETLKTILLKTYKESDLDTLFEDYNVLLLIDSIDEFERDNQIKMLEEIESLHDEKGIRFIIATRNYSYLVEELEMNHHRRVDLHNFDMTQVKLFLDNFFKFDLSKSDKLYRSLHENNIISKIPVTPLTISLVSILFEEKQYEIPATITDIYDNFSLFLLGRTSVKSNLEFLDITIKERIISMYALEIIEDENNVRKNAQEFEEFIKKFFKSKNITIDEAIYPELISSLTSGTGVLFIDENENVDFKHDYFMEYYASVEIFNQKRGVEDKLIENFTKYNWQNTAIFYTGRTKDMPDFLKKLLIRVKDYNELKDELIASSGLGYILQSLWLTDSQIRKDGVISALELIIKADQDVKRLSNTLPIFKGIRDADIALMNFFWFFSHFNSKTLEDTLTLAFDELNRQLSDAEGKSSKSDILNLQYKLFCIAATLKSDRFSENNLLDQLFDQEKILSNPLFVLLFDNAAEIIEPDNPGKIKDEYEIKNKVRKLNRGIRYYLDNTVDATRFTDLESIKPIKEIEIYTEGVTDAAYIMHAFKLMTKNSEPVWNVQGCQKKTQKESGGSHELAKCLLNFIDEMNDGKYQGKTIIGIFDNDAAGYQEFNGFKDENFVAFKNGYLKKNPHHPVYAMILPIPEALKKYNQEKQEFKFFEIEHYISQDVLEKNEMIKELPIDGLHEITGNKSRHLEKNLKILDPKAFRNFETLFMLIDEINNVNNEYVL